MLIRNAKWEDLEIVHAIEMQCFPPNEAASLETISARLKVFPHHFWLLEQEGKLVGFVNGMVTGYDRIRDEMFKDASLHKDVKGWYAVFGLAVLPGYRGNGYAAQLMKHLVETLRRQKLQGITLTCKKDLIPYYEKLGFVNAGSSQSNHGGLAWWDMQLELF